MEGARLALAEDVERVAELWALAGHELGGRRGGALLAGSSSLAGDPRPALARAIEGRDAVLALGTLDGVVVGFGYARTQAVGPARADADGDNGDNGGGVPGRAAAIGVIEVLYVEPAARGVGVGEAVADVLLRGLDELGCRGVDAFALPGSREAKAFFETHGFVTRLLVMHRSAPPEV